MLEKFAGGGDESIRVAVCKAFLSCGHEVAAEPLVQIAAKEAGETVHLTACDALSTCCAGPGSEATTGRALKLLEKLAVDGDDGVRVAVCKIFPSCGHEAAVEPLARMAAKDSSEAVRLAACHALSTCCGDPESEATTRRAVKLLEKLAGDGDESIRMAVCMVFPSCGHEVAAEPLVQIAARDASEAVHLAACDALSTCCSDLGSDATAVRTVELLEKLAFDGDDGVRAAACKVFSQLRP